MNTNSINKFIEKSTGLKKSQKVVDYTRDSGAGNIAYRLNRVDRWRQGDFHVVKYYQNTYDFYFDNVDARHKSTDVINALESLGCTNIIDHSDRGFIKFDTPKENVMNSRVIKSSQAHLHSDNMENVRERLENAITQSSVDTMYDGEDCFITVTQKNYETMNESKWSFCVDFGTGKVQMLEPTEDEESFSNDNEVFGIIKNFLNGGMSREKRRNRPDYDSGEPIKITGRGNKIGSARKPIKSSNENSRYDYDFFYDKLKDSPYFEEYVVQYDDDPGEDNIHTKNIPLVITRPDGKKQTYKDASLSFSGSGWRVSVGGWFGDSKYSDITNATIIDDRISITDSKNQEFDFFLDGNMIGSSRKPVKSGDMKIRYGDKGRVYSDSLDTYVYKNVKYKGDTYEWNDYDCLYYNTNGDEEDYMDINVFKDLPEGVTPVISSCRPVKSSKSVCVGFNTENGTLLWKRDDLYTLDGSTIRQTKRQDIADRWIEKYDLNTTDERRLDRFTQEGPSQIPWGLPLVEDKDQTNYNKKLASILPPHGYNR